MWLPYALYKVHKMFSQLWLKHGSHSPHRDVKMLHVWNLLPFSWINHYVNWYLECLNSLHERTINRHEFTSEEVWQEGGLVRSEVFCLMSSWSLLRLPREYAEWIIRSCERCFRKVCSDVLWEKNERIVNVVLNKYA